ncbi:MAG TPA: hypothetical protein VM369_07670, partial [Candidatus Binatia bacterium]|nr:hypothetical protein [Candidatus Binatia bacterium]
NVGYCSGQYCDTTNYLDGLGGGEIDPFLHSRYKDTSYGVQSRLTARAIVVEGANQGRRIALLKTDNYLAQDHLLRRVGQLLDQGSSGIRYEDILYHVSHNHSSAYYSTPAWGVWLFQDIFDQRAFELQARSMARAIELAAARLKPARMGATTIQHPNYKGNVVRPAVADDGTPAGYPLEFGDHGLVVMRFDDITDPDHPRPLAAWMNWGEHPESLDGYALHSADYLAPLERMIEREIGAPLVFSQADVGSSENTGNSAQMLADDGSVCGQWPDGAPAPLVNACLPGQGVVRDWNHHGYVQTERNVRFLADDIVRAWEQIGTDAAQVPLSDSFEVDSRLAWTPGPLSHPYPSVSNCRTDTTLSESPGVPVAGVPDCFRDLEYPEPLSPAMIQLALIAGTMEQEGIPVPDQYDASAFTGVEENLRLKLQTVRLGDVLLASCACEAQVDLILNLESRTNDVAGDIYDGFDWACLMPEHAAEQVCEVQRKYYDRASLPTPIPGHNFDPAAIAHMRAQVHNDARGWDAPANAVAANSEPLELAEIWGNFTKEELPVERGYKLAVGVGHAGDYNGYTVSYREYQNRESYRKALTAYGPHTADYMVTRLVRMAGAMHGGPELAPEPQDVLGQVDEARQILSSTLLGAATANSYDVYEAALPDDLGPAAALTQPLSIERFDAATFTWRGGSNAIDNPTVRVERETAPGFWQKYADQTGEVQTRVVYPEGVGGIIQTWAGQTDWHWTANFEAYSSFPSRLGSTPEGNFRFVVDGRKRQDHGTVNYHLVSEPFSVSAWRGIPVTNVARGGNGDLAFDTPDRVSYPASYTSGFRFINAADAGKRICEQCTFRPWATGGDVTAATVRVVRAGGAVNFVPATRSGNRWLAPTALAAGDLATITVVDSNGNTSAAVAVE